MEKNGMEISIREITEEEELLLNEKQNGENGECESNIHIWQIGENIVNSCKQFNKNNVQTIALGGEHCLFTTADSRIYSFGENSYGQLGLGDTNPRSNINLLHQFNNVKIKQIVCGARHSAVLCEDGSLFCWGDSRKGQCGLNEKGIFTTPTQVRFPPVRKVTEDIASDDSMTFITDIGCGELFTAAVDRKGMVWTWGTGFGLGHGKSYDECLGPKLIKAISNRKATQVVCGSFHCLVLTENFYEDSELMVSSPVLRTCSVSQAYKNNTHTNNSSSKIPFLKSKFYVSTDEQEHLSKSYSDSQVNIQNDLHTIDETSTSISQVDLREGLHLPELSYRKETIHLLNDTSDDSIVSTPEVSAIASSQYYSAQDVITPHTDSNYHEYIFTKSHSVNKQNGDEYENLEIEKPKVGFTFKEVQAEENVNSPFQEIKSDRSLFRGRNSVFEKFSPEEIKRASTEPLIPLKQLPRSSLLRSFSGSSDIGQTVFSGKASSFEVWSWGKGNYGQLGHDDKSDRFEPTKIAKLKGKPICRLCAGCYHSAAVTSDSQVYCWGDNTFAQLGFVKTPITCPRRVKVLSGVRVWDVACGRNFTLFLGDIDRNKTKVYFCGQVNNSKVGRSLSQPVINVSSDAIQKKPERKWGLSRRSKKNDSEMQHSGSFVDINVRELIHFIQREYVCCIYASDYSFACVTSRNSEEFEAVYQFTRMERLFYQQLKIIQKFLLDPLVQLSDWGALTRLNGGDSLNSLIDSYIDLMNGISEEIKHLTVIVRTSLPCSELFSFLFTDSFRALYDRYSKCYCNALSVGIVTACNRPASTIINRSKEIIKDLEENLSVADSSFENLMKVPLLRSHVYCDIAKKLTPFFKNMNEASSLKDVISRWSEFGDFNTNRLISASYTNKFWSDCHSKLADALKDPQRRVLKSSRDDPLSLSKASRLSSHSFILCNDVFVHLQFNRNFQVFPLVTLWADGGNDSNVEIHSIRISSPEEVFVLSTNNTSGKISWLTELNRSIASCLAACSAHNLDVEAVNPTTGQLTAAIARQAEYTFNNHLKYKGATYKGMWLDAKPHGRGRMEWPDKSIYEGEFVNGLFHGNGQMIWSSTVVGRVYDGSWFAGNMNGYGRMIYENGEEYVGLFKENVRHGHGVLKSFMSNSSIHAEYIGNWINDVKSGYGVLDYVIRGEKYMGMWLNDQRHGDGVVVTVNGVYYQGNFLQNRLVGQGLLLSDDNTSYKGEFNDDMLLNGKGVITFSNGDILEGSFYGKWGENINVSGKFCRNSKDGSSVDSFPDFRHDSVGTSGDVIDPHVKWQSLFDECYRVLGRVSNKNPEPEEAWKRVNEALINGIGSRRTQRNSTNFNIEKFRKVNYKEMVALGKNLLGLQSYLSDAFATPGHPLNILVDSLVDVYNATYVGVRVHRRLLPHAVAEAKSYVYRLFNLLSVLFPDLHDEEFVLISNDTVDGSTEVPINSVSLLHPLLLPRLYPPLITLYALHTNQSDAVYKRKLHYLNKRNDIALLSFLGVKRRFWLLPKDISIDDDSANLPSVTNTYQSAVDIFTQITTRCSPMEKIEVIRKTFAKIHEEIGNYYQGVGQVLAMDDLFPLFQFIVIRARVEHLGSEVKFIEDLVDNSILVGEAGHMVTTLDACYFQIQNEHDRD